MQIMRTVSDAYAGVLRLSFSGRLFSFLDACNRGKAGLSLLLLLAGIWPASGQDNKVFVSYSFDQPQFSSLKDEYTRVSVKGCSAFHKVGQPEVPFRTGKILLPLGSRVKQVDVDLLAEVQTLTVTKPLTFGRTPVPIGEKGHPAVARAALDAPDQNTYAADVAYPASRVQLVSVQKMNGYSVAVVRIFPIQYQPASGKLLFCPQMRVSVTLVAAAIQPQAVSMLGRHESRVARVRAFVDNPDVTASYEKASFSSVQPLTTYDYVLITTTALTNSFQPLVAQKIADGLSVKVETVENILAGYSGVDNAAKIRAFITYAYNNWNTTYVLLGGDISTVPYRQAYAYVGDVDATMPCDLYFACLDGSWNSDGDGNWGEPTDGEGGGDVDLLAEVYVGRAPVDNAAEVANFIGKTIYYEQHGPANAEKVRFLAEYLGNYSGTQSQGGDSLDVLLPSFSAYDVDWLDDRPTNAETWDGWDCVAALSQSPHLVAHDGHANETYALRMDNTYIDSLTNGAPFLLNSLGCYCGAFDYSDCFAEDLVKRNEHGAFSVLMNSRYGWFNAENEELFSGEFMACFFDELLVQDNRNIGVANQLGKQDMLGSVETSGNGMVYRWCYFEITLFGDPHTMLVGGDDLSVSPASDFRATGPEGGPFMPSSKTFGVTNAGSATVAWTATASSGLVNLSLAGGVLLPGAGTSVTATLSPTVTAFPVGFYADTILFSNGVSGASKQRDVLLKVGEPDYFTELFNEFKENDLAYQSFTFYPKGTAPFYRATREQVSDFPTDPSGGTFLSLGDDGSAECPLVDGAMVSLYGESYDTIYVGGNGYVTFGDGDDSYSESLDAHFSLPRVSALFHDLYPQSSTVSWRQLPDRVAVTYSDVPDLEYGFLNSFQIELFFNGTIRITYLDIGIAGGLAGLSAGAGIPFYFAESDFSMYGPDDDMVVTPAGGFPASGKAGGPFTPQDMIYTVSNEGASTLTWTLSHSANWVSVSSAGGSLGAGATNPVTVTLNANANALPVGHYTDTLVFHNVINGYTRSRPVTLDVLTTPVVRVAPAAITVTNLLGQTRQTPLQVGNAAWADAVLDFTLSASEVNRTPLQAATALAAGHDFTQLAEKAEYREGKLLVRFTGVTTGAQRLQALAAAGGGTVTRNYRLVPGLTVVELPEGTALATALARFNQTPGIQYAQPIYRQKLLRTPNDPLFADLWGMDNASDTDINAPEAWEFGVGGPAVTVAVIDTGVDYAHEDLAANMWRNPGEIPGNGLDDDGNGYVDDVYGYDFYNRDADPMDDHDHGTHCAGTIGGVGDNGLGVAGVCWNVKIMALKFISKNDEGYTDDAISCIEYAVMMGARVLSNSWGGGPYEQALKDAIDAAGAADVLFVAAAGNDYGNDNDSNPAYPASYESDNLIAVLSVDDAGAMSSFSNFGLGSVDLGAPGSDILSCKRNGGYQYMSGTSMATPHVSGACALLLSLNSGFSCQQVKNALLATTDSSLPGLCVSGGRMNLAEAVTYTPAWLSVSPVSGANVAPGAWSSITVSADAGTLAAGTYEGLISVRCNDLDTPVTNVPVKMVVLQDNLTVQPYDAFVASGYTGGPFTPVDATYTLSNTGLVGLAWTATSGHPWVSVSPAGGTLAARQTVQVTVSLNAESGLLSPGEYMNSVVFSNVTSTASQRREVELTVLERVLDHLEWAPLPPTQYVGEPFGVTVKALDPSGSVCSNFTGTVSLYAQKGVASQQDVLTGTADWGYPMYTYYHDARTQVIYLNGELGAPGLLTSLSLYVSGVPGQTMNAWTIRLKHTSLAGYSSSAKQWETNDWIVALQTNMTIQSTGWVKFDFTTPFIYNGTDNLLVDFSFNNTFWTSEGYCWSTLVSTNRSLYYRTDSGYGDPLTWSGTMPPGTITNCVPVMRIDRSEVVPITPTETGNFINGVWNGTLTVLESASNVTLYASDRAGHLALSAPFEAVGGATTSHGTSYSWLDLYGLVSGGNYEAADLADADGDGHAAWQEYKAGTVPTNRLSVLQMQAVIPGSGTGGIHVNWQSVAGKHYWVESCETLTYPIFFTPFVSNVLGQAGSTEVMDNRPAVNGSRFYRVGVQQE